MPSTLACWRRMRILLLATLLLSPAVVFRAIAALPPAHHPLWPPLAPHVPSGAVPVPPITAVNTRDNAGMIYIPAGKFLMGGANQADNPRRVIVLSGYWIYKDVVTVAQYRQFCRQTGRQMPPVTRWAWWDDHPIANVTWQDASDYCKWAGGSLPTEAQWEKAARGIDGRKYPWGNTWDPTRLWGSAVRESTRRVGSYPSGASPYGCLDMSGNVWQWCADWYDENYPRSLPDGTRDPAGPATGTKRTTRGGSWNGDYEFDFRCEFRYINTPSKRYNNVGFRCCVPAGSG